jgi:hypothetical protein
MKRNEKSKRRGIDLMRAWHLGGLIAVTVMGCSSSTSPGGNTGSGGAAKADASGAGGSAGGANGSGGALGSGGGAGAGTGGAISVDGGSDARGGASGTGGSGPCPGSGRALAFNGTDGVVLANLGADLPLGDTSRTIEMWIYMRASSWQGEVNTLFEYGNRNTANGGRGVFGVDFASYNDARGNLQVFVGNGAYDYFFNAGLGATTYVGWFHIASVYDQATHTMYATVNGVQKGSRVLTAGQTIQSQSTDFSIGRTANYPMTGAYFDGMIDEVRMWNVARTPQQIMQNMSVRLAGTEPGLVGYWHFDEGSGTSTQDATARRHDGTLTGGVTWVATSGVTLTCP